MDSNDTDATLAPGAAASGGQASATDPTPLPLPLLPAALDCAAQLPGLEPPCDQDLRSQLGLYAAELRSVLARSRASSEALEPALSQLRMCGEELQGLMRSSQQAVSMLERSCVATLSWLVDAVDRRDGESRGHAQRVSQYAQVIAESLGLSASETARITTAARLHDAGRVEWPDTILLKKGALSANERKAIEMHCGLSEALSGTPSPLLTAIADVVAHHHEHWDGSGYPNGVNGEGIPLAARVVQLADVYDTLRTAYRYKLTQSHAAACRAILQGDRRVSPGHFDPTLLDAFGRAAARLATPQSD